MARFRLGLRGYARGYEEAALLPNADFFAAFYAAVANAMTGWLDAEARSLEQAWVMRPGLTAAGWRGVFDFLLFARMVETSESAMQKLIALGFRRSSPAA